MQPLFWDPMQFFLQRKHVFFPLPKSGNSSPVGDSSGQGLKSLLASTKLVPAPRVKDAAEKLLAKLQRNETAVGAPAQAQERWGWDGMGWDGMGWDGMGWDGMGWDGMVVSKGGLLQSFVFNKPTKRHKKYTQKRLKLLSIRGSMWQTLRVEDQTYGKQWHWNNKWNIYLQNRLSTI